MSDIPDEAQGLADDILKFELKGSDATTDLFGKYGEEVGLDAMHNSVQKVLENSNSIERKKKAIGILHGISVELENERMVEVTKNAMEKLEND